MKNYFKRAITGFISFSLCFLIFFVILICQNLTFEPKEQTAVKSQSSIPYSPSQTLKSTSIKITLEGCATSFLLEILPENKKINVYSNPDLKNKKYVKKIDFTIKGFEGLINYLNGVEIETPYGLPAPSKNGKLLAKNEKLSAYGASISALFCGEKNPTAEKTNYFCYVLGEICLKFLKEGDTELYKFLNKNSKTNISYTDYYDNYKSLKTAIKYADITEN